MSAALKGRDLVSLLDFTADQVRGLIDTAITVKREADSYRDALAGQTLFMYFEKPSLRTRVTFETGMTQLGGHAIYYSGNEGRIGVRESVADVARNLERWVNGAMMRTFSHDLVKEMAQYSSIPIINGLTDHLHPCQALADFLTLAEVRSDLKGGTLAYVGDGNNVANSLMYAGARLGVNVHVIHPEGFGVDEEVQQAAQEAANETGATMRSGTDLALVEGADAVYTDVWASMGQEDEATDRDAVFRPYQVNEALMERAGKDAVFMHCLPAHRGDEVTDGVADSKNSVIFQQAENRLHAQKAVMLALMG